jgi:hypothetical protein
VNEPSWLTVRVPVVGLELVTRTGLVASSLAKIPVSAGTVKVEECVMLNESSTALGRSKGLTAFLHAAPSLLFVTDAVTTNVAFGFAVVKSVIR